MRKFYTGLSYKFKTDETKLQNHDQIYWFVYNIKLDDFFYEYLTFNILKFSRTIKCNNGK